MSQSRSPKSQLRNAQQRPGEPDSPCLTSDLVCFSHLRWDFVFQRPHHLLSRFARHRRVFFVEEPIVVEKTRVPRLEISRRAEGLIVVQPHLPMGAQAETAREMQRFLVDELFVSQEISDFTLWYYTPMALAFTDHLVSNRVIYDCMDELSAFKGAPGELLDLENELFDRAHHVFTGGESLFEAKRGLHPSVHSFPSSIDFAHFAQARKPLEEPLDQRPLAHPRVGFFGVIDERADLELIEKMATLRPDWQIVMIGPVVKIEEAALPRLPNIHYLGKKSYDELPRYLAHWDLAILPFAINESTRFISPTKTPEYLAAGRPVVSTPIRDVVRPYGEKKLVHIARTADEFIAAGDRAMHEAREDRSWRTRVDAFLASTSWDKNWAEMATLEKNVGKDSRRHEAPIDTKLRRDDSHSRKGR